MILDFSLLLLVKLSLWILFTFLVSHPRKKGIATLRIYQCWILNHKVIETCFEMLKSSEHENLRSYSSYWFSRFNWSPNLKLLFRIVITMYVYGEHAIQKMKQIDDFWTIINITILLSQNWKNVHRILGAPILFSAIVLLLPPNKRDSTLEGH